MEQALKVIKFDPDEKLEEEQSSRSYNKSIFLSELLPLRIVLISVAILGVLALILEVRIYFQFRYEIYLARLIPTILSFLTLILLQTKFGKKNHILLTHIYLFSILASLSFVIYKIPALYIYNLVSAALFILTLSLFFYWGRINQIILSSYFLVLFGSSAFASGLLSQYDVNLFLFSGTVFLILVISIIGSHLRAGTSKNISKTLLNSDSDLDNSDVDEESYRSLFAESIIPLFQIKINGEFKSTNVSFREIFEFQKEEEINELNFFDDFVRNENVKNHLLKKIENKGKVENYRFTYSRKDGSTEILLMDCKSKSIDDEIFLEGSVRNITYQFHKDKAILKELDSLRQSKKQSPKIIPNFYEKDVKKSNIISRMGHELRTPMNSVLGFLTLIENGLFENEEELKEYSHSAKLSAEALLGLIIDVVEISKIQDGSVEIVKNEFDIREEIEKTVSSLSPHLKQNRLKLSYDFDVNIPEKILADQYKYFQIITNLLRNAISATENGNITLTVNKKKTDKGKEQLITKIKDSGDGITEDDLEKLLNADLDSKAKDYKITSGVLHIMICRELISLLDGSLSATSVLGSGTEFSFIIDLESNKESLENDFSNDFNKRANYHIKPKLLLVEDNPISRKVEQKLLQEAGYEVDCVENGSDALSHIEKGIYNLVLMDIELKDMNGLDATKLIRQLPEGINNIPIIAVTAHSSMKDREKCLVAGMNDYISKPINITFLKMTIDQWLNEARVK